ncbi:MAG: kelch repeat-containing protein, partial [Myxococcota bacterium]
MDFVDVHRHHLSMGASKVATVVVGFATFACVADVVPLDLPAFDASTCEPRSLKAWRAVAPMNEARFAHTATPLSDGAIVVVGGFSGRPLTSTELYSVERDQWREVGPLRVPRHRHTATRLLDGRVLVVGGDAPGTALSEIFDPVEQTWRPGPQLPFDRFRHTATRMPDGTVWIIGGSDGQRQVNEVWIYDPVRDRL